MGKWRIEKERHWHKIVARYARSGMKVRAFCDREQTKEHQFFTWRRERRRCDVARTANQNDRRRGGRHGSVGPTADPHVMAAKAAAVTPQAAAFAPAHGVTTPPATPSSIEIIAAAARPVR